MRLDGSNFNNRIRYPHAACGITWADAERDSEVLELDGVEIPIAGIETLIRTKQTVRPHDAADREYLERLLRS